LVFIMKKKTLFLLTLCIAFVLCFAASCGDDEESGRKRPANATTPGQTSSAEVTGDAAVTPTAQPTFNEEDAGIEDFLPTPPPATGTFAPTNPETPPTNAPSNGSTVPTTNVPTSDATSSATATPTPTPTQQPTQKPTQQPANRTGIELPPIWFNK